MKTCPHLTALTCALLVLGAPLLDADPIFNATYTTGTLRIDGTTPAGNYAFTANVTTFVPTTISLSYSQEGVGSSASLTSWLTPTEMNAQLATSVFHAPLPPGFGESDAMAGFGFGFRVSTPTLLLFDGWMPGPDVGTNLRFVSFGTQAEDLIVWWPEENPQRTELLLLSPGNYSLGARAVNRLATHQTPEGVPLEQQINLTLRIVPDSNSTALCAALGLLALAGLRLSLRSRAAFGLK